MSAFGLMLLLVAQGAPPAQPSSQPSSQPAALLPGGTAADLNARATIIFELDETMIRAQESWSLQNPSGKRIEPNTLVFPIPGPVRRLAVDEERTQGFTVGPTGAELMATAALGAGQKELNFTYAIESQGSVLHVRRPTPVHIEAGRLILEQVDGLKLEANVPFTSRTSNLNGIEFAIFDFGGLAAGSVLDLKINGMPYKSAAPRNIAVLFCLGLIGWTIYVLVNQRSLKAKVAPPLGAMSAQARRDQIVKALELLERDREADKVKDKRYQRRHAELMQELATVLREIEISRALSGPGA